MEEITKLLTSIHFSEQEAKIYVQCLKTPGVTVFQVAKNLHLSRSSIYPVMNHMTEKGYLLLEQGEKELYYAETPETLFSNLNMTYNKHINDIKDAIHKIPIEVEQEPYLNIHGFNEIIGKARTLIYSAQSEIYLNTDLDMSLFDDAFKFQENKGIDVFAFSFQMQSVNYLNMHLYTRNFDPFDATRLMIVIDHREVLVANKNPLSGHWSATLTKNQLMVSIISEHIHHDIYLLKLDQKYKKDLFSLYPDLEIGSKQEKKVENIKNLVEPKNND